MNEQVQEEVERGSDGDVFAGGDNFDAFRVLGVLR